MATEISTEILLDSINDFGERITTWKLVMPRFILSELNTHRAFSRNSASSRAIRTEKLIDMVLNDPCIPKYWGKLQKGMQAEEELDADLVSDCIEIWCETRDVVVENVKKLFKIGLHKQIVNRLLEPFMWHKVLMTATDMDNFFELRADSQAEPHFADLAYKMLALYNAGKPVPISAGDWHIPFGDQVPPNFTIEQKLKIATARAARVSYMTFEGKIDFEADFKLHDSLLQNGHMSPFEHCAVAAPRAKLRSGNFVGWEQYRKMFPNENRVSPRVAVQQVFCKKSNFQS